jgi:carboxypeptidase Taq
MTHPAYDELTAAYTRLHRFQHLQSLAYWDRAANMPPNGNDARAAALAEMEALLHRLRTDPQMKLLIERAAQEPLDEAQRANLREIRRDWRASNALPERLVERKTLASARCEHAWRTQRPANDWQGFLLNFREVLGVAREEARRLADAGGMGPYDALLDKYEPGMSVAQLDRLFDGMRQWLPGLVARAVQRQSQRPLIEPQGPFSIAAQRALSHDVMKLLDFDFSAGRLDESAHPFSGGVPEDVRLTTRYREHDMVQSLMGTVHETGHARYEQNLPRDWLGQPMALARSMGIHESQSLSFEMQLGSHPGFARLLAPLVSAHFGVQPAFAPENLQHLLTRVKPGLIRVEADEVTYPAHVLLRYDIERALIEGAIEAEDVPALWDEKMQSLLGVDTRGNYRDGCMQDVHWSECLFGYFPCYTLGAMYAAQWFAAIRRATPDLDARIAAGDLGVVFDWLRANIWLQGSRWTTDELAVHASGETLNVAHFKAHLEARYLE